ncbi:hypothetical protein [Polyangium aurulentum]|uniref:hypothetical protein n=1 Tax=Polyangium aurulentum TaxID=2567896 RepID=UPI001469E0CB|nr:hypothetical protein [Polyangium aurulentum]UQA62862.1 hypothetical protein E8A73_021375 [Polyangium aurulentum]
MHRSTLRSALALAPFLVLLAACASPSTDAPPPETPAPPATPAPPSDRVCTEIGCLNGLSVDLQSAGGWKPGKYRFEFDFDGTATTCEATLPLRACDAGPSVTCSPNGAVTIGESGCALPPEQHGFSGFNVEGMPRSVKVRITRDGATLAEATSTPSYRKVQPNGEGCPPVCQQGHEAVRVP